MKAHTMKVETGPSQSSGPGPAKARDLTRKLEDIGFATTPKLALLIRWSEAEALTDRGGTSTQLEHLAWRGIEILCRDVLRDVEDLLRTPARRRADSRW